MQFFLTFALIATVASASVPTSPLVQLIVNVNAEAPAGVQPVTVTDPAAIVEPAAVAEPESVAEIAPTPVSVIEEAFVPVIPEGAVVETPVVPAPVVLPEAVAPVVIEPIQVAEPILPVAVVEPETMPDQPISVQPVIIPETLN